jgi:4-hydroxybenzoate polyprenyltransferase
MEKRLLTFLRFPNLIIIGLSQYLLRYCLLMPILARNSDGSLRISDLDFVFLVAMTICAGAAGYVINDIIDESIDRLNKPEKQFVGTVYSIQQSWNIYWFCLVIGLISSLILSISSQYYWFTACYIATCAVLYAYSRWLKQRAVWGNLTVAFFTGSVTFGVGMPILEPPYSPLQATTFYLFVSYIAFAFLSNWWREIVKDIEDMDGDAAFGCQTLPIRFGVKTAKVVASSVGFTLLIGVVLFCNYLLATPTDIHRYAAIGLAISVLIPILINLCLLWRATQKSDYSLISKITKLIMIAGLLVALFIK